ncbi:Hypothetical protein A7982_02371 [Minicystis rosea]|nr:Hypothetical protein A7982_02371 [Minicystis rosea]
MERISIGQLFKKVQDRVGRKVPAGGAMFGLANGNLIGKDGYLWDTPHGNWTGSPSVEPGHSDAFPAQIEEVISGATKFIDIATMKVPTGKFWAAIKDGLKAVAKAKREVTARILIGFPMRYHPPNLWDQLKEIGEALREHPGYVTVDLGIYRYYTIQTYPEGWNHAKLIAVDGEVLITGGHNLWDEDYLGLSPVFDLSLKLEGPIARGGHAFANGLWSFVTQHNRTPHTYSHRLKPDLSITNDPPAQAALPTADPVGRIDAMWVAEPGRGVFRTNTGEEFRESTMMIAFLAALETASHCRISQQSFGSFPVEWKGPPPQFSIRKSDQFPYAFIYHRAPNGSGFEYNLSLVDALATFLVRNHEKKRVLEILMSPPDGGRYSNGEADAGILDVVAYRMKTHDRFRNATKEELVAQLNKQVWLNWPAITGSSGPIRIWTANGKAMANHSKFWMVDERIFYVGSENMYPTVATEGLVYAEGGLQEFGIIAEADDSVRDLLVNQYHALAMDHGFRRTIKVGDLSF